MLEFNMSSCTSLQYIHDHVSITHPGNWNRPITAATQQAACLLCVSNGPAAAELGTVGLV